MSKLLFKEQVLRESVIQSLSNTVEEMKLATQKTYAMNIPSGFPKYTELASCKNSIVQLSTELQNLKKWLEDSCKIVDDAITSMNNESLLLPQSQLQTRKEVVR